MLRRFFRNLLSPDTPNVDVQAVEHDRDLAALHESRLVRALAELGDRHVLVRKFDRPGDYWRTRKQLEKRADREDFDARR